MKKLLVILMVVQCMVQDAYGQSLHIDSTRFITGTAVGTGINYAIQTADKGILFTGSVHGNPGGIIPYFPIDTGVNGNVLVGKIDNNQQISWVKVFGGSDGDWARDAVQTTDGGYAILATTSSVNGDVTGLHGGADLWLLRLDSTGNLLWQKCYGSTGGEGAVSMSNTPDHGFIILGLTSGSDGDVPFHYGSIWVSDWLVVKTDSVGNKQWSKNIGGTQTEGYGSILAIDSSYYLVGRSSSNDNDCTDSVWHIGAYTGSDYHVLKLDNAGSVLWDSSYGGSGADLVSRAMFDTRDSTIVIIGTTNSVDYMVTGFHYCSTFGGDDAWVVKVDRSGKLSWQKTVGSVEDETGKDICVSQSGGYMACAYKFAHPCDDENVDNIGGQDCIVFELDNSGNTISEKVFGGISVDDPNAIVPYLNGYVVAGESGSSVFTEGSCNVNYSGAFVSYLGYSFLDVKELAEDQERGIKIFPNPAHDAVYIKNISGETGYRLLSSIGSVVQTGKLTERVNSISLRQLPVGLYLLELTEDNGRKIVSKILRE